MKSPENGRKIQKFWNKLNVSLQNINSRTLWPCVQVQPGLNRPYRLHWPSCDLSLHLSGPHWATKTLNFLAASFEALVIPSPLFESPTIHGEGGNRSPCYFSGVRQRCMHGLNSITRELWTPVLCCKFH